MGESSPGGFEELVFRQELNEVFLLLDFVSGRPDKRLAELDDKIVDPDNPALTLKSAAVIERVSRLRYPPAQPDGQKAKDAAFLLALKDRLNCIAYPARGLTIAYTIIFTESRSSALVQSLWGLAGWVGRAIPRLGTVMPDEDATTPNRVRVAQLAFPRLTASAAGFRRAMDAFTWIALVITVLSASLLWQVTYGAQLAVRFEQARQTEGEWTAKLYGQLEKERPGGEDFKLPENLPAYCAPVASRRLAPAALIEGDEAAVSLVLQTTDVAAKSAAMHLYCNDYAFRHALLGTAVADVDRFRESWMFFLANWLMPMHPPAPSAACADDRLSAACKDNPISAGRQEDAQSVAGVLAMMTNYMLPICFGLVGTMAALVRGLQDKVTDSILAPRDRALSLIRVPLGMMAGVCVGLFFNPATAAAQSSGVGAVTFSASGIAFLAGYGAEGFFRMLDLLITRIFSLEPPPRPK